MMPEDLVPLAEGARRLGLAHDTARKQLATGKLRGEKRQGRWWVWVPMPDDAGPLPEGAGSVPDASLIAHLEGEIAYLRQQLDHQTRITAGLVEQLRALPPSETPPVAYEKAPLSDVSPVGVPDVPDTLIDRVRRLLGRR